MKTHAGQHSIHVEDDMIFIVIRGQWDLADLEKCTPLADSIIAKYGYFYTVTDVSEMASATPDARRYAAHWAREQKVAGVAVYGSSLLTRTVLTMVMRAVTLMRAEKFPFAFVRDEQDARRWVALQRPGTGPRG